MPANRPAPEELLAAIREYLEQGIKPLLATAAADARTDEENATKSRTFSVASSLPLDNAIAINLLKLLERESQLRTAQLAQEYDLLCELLPDSGVDDDLDALNTLLIELIESPQFVDTNKTILRALQQISLSKLAIDNPAYSTFRKHRQ